MRLLQPVSLGETRFSNRVIFGPHVTNLGDNRALSARHVAYYQRRAAAGVGAIIIETASVHPGDWPYERAPLATDCGPGWQDIAAACTPYDTRVLASLGHTGLQGSTAYSRGVLWGPSRFADPVTREQPLRIGTAQIAKLVSGFADAAALARRSGLAGVEVDIGPRSLLRQFQSSLTNTRDDEYGADPMLLTRSVLTAVRRELGPDRVLAVRLCCDERTPWAGITPAVATAQAIEVAAYADLLTVVRGGVYSTGHYRPDAHTPAGFNRELTAQIRAAVDIPVAAQGSITTAELAEDLLCSGAADLIEMTRAQIADAELVAKLRTPELGTPRPCVLCNQKCQVRDSRNPIASCVGDPRSGHESTDLDVHVATPTKGRVVVVGAGVAGLEAARVCARRGYAVTVLERDAHVGGVLGGTSLDASGNGATFAPLVDWLMTECLRLGVDLRLNTVADAECLRESRAAGDIVVLATGSRFASRWSGALDPVAVLAGDALSGGDGPIVVGDPIGGPIGVRLGEVLAARGYAVTLVSPDPVAGTMLAATGDLPDANARLQRAGVVRRLCSTIRDVTAGGVLVEDIYTGAHEMLACQAFVDAGHRLPKDRLYADPLGGAAGIDRIGDCVAPRTVHEAILDGRRWALALTSPLTPASPIAPASPAPPPAARPLSRQAPPWDGTSGVTRSFGRQGTPRYPNLHSPLRVGPLTLRNRIVFAAHLTNFAVDGRPTARHVDYYARRARGGAGLIITEEHSTHPNDWPYEKMIRGYRPEVVDGYRQITGAVHEYDAKIMAQLNHNGPQASGMYSRLPVWGPSAIPDPMFREVPVAVGAREIRQLVDGFARVARHCADGGFDGVELQCSQSSILRCFLSRATNTRTDEYGGTLRGRARLLLQIIDAVRREVGEGLALGVRISGEERVDNGTTLDEAVALAEILADTRQVDVINTTVGVATSTLDLVIPSMRVPPDYARHIPAAIRAAVDIPVIGVGRFKDPKDAEEALAAGQADLIGVVRGQIADPDFAVKSAATDGAGPTISTCLSCNQECVGNVGMNRALGCVVNPAAGRESLTLRPTRAARDVLVVGAGPAGLQAAISASAAGHRVRIVEAAFSPGGQVRLAAQAPHRAEFGTLVDNLLSEVRRRGISLDLGTRLDADAIQRANPDVVVVATGARPAAPTWAAGNARVVDVRDVLDRSAEPRGRVVVVDELGFHQGTSVAELLAERGCQVEVVTPAMVIGQDLGLTLDLPRWHARAHALGITTRTDVVASAVSARERGLELTLHHHPTDTIERLQCDWIVCAIQQRPADELWQSLAEADFEVRRIGDCVAPRRADAAIFEGAEVGASL
ncbi:mycofactocin system FadH/OYE family oxidoreductase 1/mycofactocin system FadH/OYE family oxidoreductase 2 [Antricoccus suffuscus]|uniref:Mycofactocin system FadH/OYE family oxidoreductase 1/mycofactocin system FadH/OYE family oxidoreductase 2 n=1 Tax=Antricoccus suffuscus TaxID=1629062 RepID=A0A2T1A0E6_9ACTN|nr:mycofactocin system FadH/OYE family oxidoreductase 2 [Antricoccus suffuscus]PRZ42004.1 mycofactocin system FadH/OYE family oxidoreductase 1/mycofactocin system FadH/OYE family oxidoreductase 2 [Antricoccus suffuscus]